MSINIIADYHTHTNMARGHIPLYNLIFGVHAKGSIQSNVLAAVKLGLEEIAITDHGYRHIAFGMKTSQYKDVRRMVDEINSSLLAKDNNFRLLLGIECNILNKKGDLDITDEVCKYLDIICAGYHPGALKSPSLKKDYTEAAINAIENHSITILNHPLDHVDPDIIEIGRVAAKRNTALEINRLHKNLDKEAIKTLKGLGVKFSLGSDSHKSEDVGHFGKAYYIAAAAGLSNDDIINAEGIAHSTMKLLN